MKSVICRTGRRVAIHQYGIDAHVDDAAVLAEAGAPARSFASGFQASGKNANIHDSRGAVGDIPDLVHERRSWMSLMDHV